MAAEQAEGDSGNVWLVVGAVVAVLAGLVGVLAATNGDDEPKGPIRNVRAEASAAAERWLGAWAADDRAELHRLLAAPAPSLDGVLDQFEDGLHPVRISAEAGAPPSPATRRRSRSTPRSSSPAWAPGPTRAPSLCPTSRCRWARTRRATPSPSGGWRSARRCSTPT